jgi:lysophospholipase L1-like esterase
MGGNKTNASFDQVGFVYSNRTGKTSFLNLAFNFHKSRNFDQILSAAASLQNASLNKLTYNKGVNLLVFPQKAGMDLYKRDDAGKIIGYNHKPDFSKYRIMIFGDSMLEWLAKRLCDYSLENGYDLSSIIWYSSSTKLWATTDTLQYFLDRIQPDYVMLCLGGNELFVRDLSKREKYIDAIVKRIGDRPFLWIGPPNWKKDTGINDLILQRVGEGRFFDSRELELDRAEDNMHPTRSAAALWMDTIAVWLSSSKARHPLKMDRPTQSRRRVYHQYMLRPPR